VADARQWAQFKLQFRVVSQATSRNVEFLASSEEPDGCFFGCVVSGDVNGDLFSRFCYYLESVGNSI